MIELIGNSGADRKFSVAPNYHNDGYCILSVSEFGNSEVHHEGFNWFEVASYCDEMNCAHNFDLIGFFDTKLKLVNRRSAHYLVYDRYAVDVDKWESALSKRFLSASFHEKRIILESWLLALIGVGSVQ